MSFSMLDVHVIGFYGIFKFSETCVLVLLFST